MLDTNVLISMILFPNVSFDRMLDYIVQNHHLVLSSFVVDELLVVASAIYAGCGYFISTDKRLLKYQSKEIKMVTPIEFVIEIEED